MASRQQRGARAKGWWTPWVAAAVCWATQAGSAAGAQQRVQVTEGALQGALIDGVQQFRGIPYAQAPVGALRWVAPQSPRTWSGVRDASTFGAACPQRPEPFAAAGPQSEDCLFLNVYVPPTTKPRPVIFWIPGGGTVLGAGAQYDASKLSLATDAVVVTINYRLGALGWLWTSGMAAEKRGHNFALQDQQAAMRWVQRNIAAFGGDPGRVTLVGESIGATSASVHLTSPSAAGLFQRVILASGVEAPGLPSAEQAAQRGDGVAASLGCPSGASQMACLRGLSVPDLLANAPGYADIGRQGVPWTNFVDGEVVAQDVLKAISRGEFNRVPIMVGSTLDEGRGFIPLSYDLDGTPMTEAEYKQAIRAFLGPSLQPVLTDWLYPVSKYGAPNLAASQVWTDLFACQSNELAQRAHSQVPVFMYEFADRQAPVFVEDPFIDQGAFHASDLLYWFQTPPGGAPLQLSPRQLQLSQQMQRYWKRFVHEGDPGSTAVAAVGDPAWPRYGTWRKPVLSLAPQATQVLDWGAFQRSHQCSAWSFFIALRLAGLG